jgi:hypothetical protein
MRPGRGRRQACVALLSGVCTALLLSGCAEFPDRGPVVSARRLESSGVSLPFFAAPPVPGASPRAIVRGFLQAGSDFHQDHRVAREYVSSGRTQWQAEAPVVVLDGASLTVSELSPAGNGNGAACPPPSAPGSATPSRSTPRDGETADVCVSGHQLARVDDVGVMHLASPAGSMDDKPDFSRVFTLEVQHGQWRITMPPDGLVLTQTEFDDTFRALPLYFPDRSATWLVPDQRWFPDFDQSDITPTAALEVSALLRGPAGWLAPAVAPTVPPGTSLTPVGSVQIDGGTARVDLSHRVQEAKTEQRLLLRAQLLATLQALSQQGFATVSDVVLTTEQAKLDVPDGEGPTPWTPPATPGVPKFGRDDAISYGQNSPLCLTDKYLVGQLARTAKGDATCTHRQDLDALAKMGLALATSDSAAKVFAGLVTDRSRIVAMTAGDPVQTVVTGAQLTPPSVDGQGWVWSSSASGWVLAGGVDRQTVRVAAPWLRGRQVIALRLSPEGARALLLVRSNGRTRRDRPVVQALVVGVIRDAAGRPQSLSGPGLAVLPDLTGAVDAGWSAPDQVVVVGARQAEPGRVYAWQVPVGGEPTPLLSRPLPRTAAGLAVGVGDLLDVFVRTSDGKAVVSSLGSWEPVAVRGLTLPS